MRTYLTWIWHQIKTFRSISSSGASCFGIGPTWVCPWRTGLFGPRRAHQLGAVVAAPIISWFPFQNRIFETLWHSHRIFQSDRNYLFAVPSRGRMNHHCLTFDYSVGVVRKSRCFHVRLFWVKLLLLSWLLPVTVISSYRQYHQVWVYCYHWVWYLHIQN